MMTRRCSRRLSINKENEKDGGSKMVMMRYERRRKRIKEESEKEKEKGSSEMMMYERRRKRIKEESDNAEEIDKENVAEDWCFVCKDGGKLIICELGDCLKVYHPGCVGKKVSFLEGRESWTCNWHYCSICHKSPKFQCFCCPYAICECCMNAAEFAPTRGKKGFCSECLKLVLFAEENVEYDSDGGKIDFNNRDTYEGLFKEYWDIVKDEEGLTLDDVSNTKAKMKNSENEHELIRSVCDLDEMEQYRPLCKRRKSKAQVFMGWGSKPLIEFLQSLGQDITKQLTQFDVDRLIFEYIQENKLLDPLKKKKVLCDERLHSLFGKKSVSKNRIYNLLDVHFAENLVQSEEDEIEHEDKTNSRVKNENFRLPSKKKTILSSDKSPSEEVERIFQQTGYASIITENIKLLYLRRSLVEVLLKDRNSFSGKIVGSLVKVKNDPMDYLQKNSHQLAQVVGVKETSSAGKINSEILLQASSVPMDIRISLLSDSDFTKEELEDLQQKVKNGVHKKLTVVELEQKARSLRADIMKHWIERELVQLQNRIDYSNEKGLRKEYPFMERLINQVPEVVAEFVELEVASGNSESDKQLSSCSPQSIVHDPKTPST
uniref:Uncharacterized protein n=1 Tax=Quercus lobata TaxID=97700 RepID=A0A7N2LT39_QUELO